MTRPLKLSLYRLSSLIWLCVTFIYSPQDRHHPGHRMSLELVRWLVWLAICFTTGRTEDHCDRLEPSETLRHMLFVSPFSDIVENTVMSTQDSPCQIYWHNQVTLLVTGNNCPAVPPDPKSGKLHSLSVTSTGIIVLQAGAFQSYSSLETLLISSNNALREIQPGAFDGLVHVWNLTMSDNKIENLHPESFRGLENLLELRYLRNNLYSIKDITPSLVPSILPNLTYLDLSGNAIASVEDDEFLPMMGSELVTLVLAYTKTYYISPKALMPFSRLNEIGLGHNNINNSVLAALLETLISFDPYLTCVGLQANLMFVRPQQVFDILAKSNITQLNLSENHFGELYPGFFPPMPNLRHLILDSLLIGDIKKGVISVMPRLENLDLRRNRIAAITSSMESETLKMLDLSKNGDATWQSKFHIPLHFLTYFPSVQILNLSENKLMYLRRGTFSNCTNLKVLFMSSAGITTLSDYIFENCSGLAYLDLSQNMFNVGDVKGLSSNTFAGLENLDSLDLSDCGLSKFTDPNMFAHLKTLRYLSLRRNAFSQLDGMFSPLVCLKHLDLRNNILPPWDNQVFGNNRLESLFLDGNQISTITVAMYKDWQYADNMSLFIDPLRCDCDLVLSTREFLQVTQSQFSSLPIKGWTRPKCYQPVALRDTYLYNWLRDIIFTRQCYFMNTATKAVLGVFLSLLFLGIIFLIWFFFKYHIKYWYYVVKDKIGLRVFRNHPISKEYEYDAFISYSHEDERFVHRMTAILENQFNFKLCIYERDFMIGELISESVMEKLSRSKKAVMVLSEAFAKSQWCLWELHIAQQRTFFRAAAPDSLIIVKLTDIDESLMTPTLRHLMSARIYLKWESGISRQRLFWQQLKAAIRKKAPGQN